MKRVGGAGVVAMWALSIGTAVPALAEPVPGLNPAGEQAAQIQMRLQKDPASVTTGSSSPSATASLR